MLQIILYQQKILVESINDQIVLPSIASLKDIKSCLNELYVSDQEYVATFTQGFDDEINHQLKLISLRQAISHFDKPTIHKIIYFQQLVHYYTTHQYCGSCGNKTIRNKINKFVSCSQCNLEIYPHIAPCVIVRIHKNKQILLARGINFPQGAWGLIAGFVEIGETLEQALHREVKEEVGIEIDNLKYWGSQPWPFPSSSLMVGFTATYKSGEIKLDPNEIESAGFYTKENLPGTPSVKSSIASQMINEYINV